MGMSEGIVSFLGLLSEKFQKARLFYCAVARDLCYPPVIIPLLDILEILEGLL